MVTRWLRVSVFLQRFRAPLLVVGCSGLYGLNLIQHLVPDVSFCPLYQAWHRGRPVQLSPHLEALFRQVLSDVTVHSPQKFTPFAAFGFHPVGAGLPVLPSGAHVGIPANFNSSTSGAGSEVDSGVGSEGITDRTLLIGGRAVDWSSAAGHALRDSLVMSEHAQMFALAREVARLDGCFPALTAAVGPLCVGGAWAYGVALKQMFGLHTGAPLLRAAAYTLALGLGAVTYLLASDAAVQYVDYSVDRRAATVAPGYAEGGVEFYDKILSRNRTLRALMGSKGKEMYAANGNLFPANILQLKHTPYTARRDAINTIIQQKV